MHGDRIFRVKDGLNWLLLSLPLPSMATCLRKGGLRPCSVRRTTRRRKRDTRSVCVRLFNFSNQNLAVGKKVCGDDDAGPAEGPLQSELTTHHTDVCRVA